MNALTFNGTIRRYGDRAAGSEYGGVSCGTPGMGMNLLKMPSLRLIHL